MYLIAQSFIVAPGVREGFQVLLTYALSYDKDKEVTILAVTIAYNTQACTYYQYEI